MASATTFALEPCRFTENDLAQGDIELVGGPSDGDRHPVSLFRGQLPSTVELISIHVTFENRQRTISRRYLIIECYRRRGETLFYEFASRKFFNEYHHPELFSGFSAIQQAVASAGGGE